jgi:acetyl-CoA C-acetyltransferase
MPEAYIFDAVRTPRGRGKKDGSLHELTALSLATQVLEQIRDRNGLDTSRVDDVILGCVAPVGEQGADIARTAVLSADYAQTTAGVQINRFCASGLEAVNMAAAKVHQRRGRHGHRRRRREHEPRAHGLRRRRLADRPSSAFKTYFTPQGVSADLIASKYGFSRDDVDAYAVESQKRAARSWQEGRFKNSVITVKDQLGLPILDRDEHMRPKRPCRRSAR